MENARSAGFAMLSGRGSGWSPGRRAGFTERDARAPDWKQFWRHLGLPRARCTTTSTARKPWGTRWWMRLSDLTSGWRGFVLYSLIRILSPLWLAPFETYRFSL